MGKLPFEKRSTEMLIKKQTSSGGHGSDPYARSIQELLIGSLVNIDKPAGPTSHQTAEFVKIIVHSDKAGHSGTLDPQVTGVLSVAIGKATRVVQALQSAGKEYLCYMHLHKPCEESDIRRVCDDFTGVISQLPPIKSAVKRQWRDRNIYYIEILEIKNNQEVLFLTGTQAGTYIRKLCHDMGQALGCGAHMAELRRTKAGPFHETECVTLQDLTDAYHYYTSSNNEKFLRKILLPIEEGVKHIPKIVVLDSCVDAICHGASLAVPGIAQVQKGIHPEEMVAIMTLRGELVAIGKSMIDTRSMIERTGGFAARLEAVFMAPGLYPKRQIMQEQKPQ